MIKMQGVKRRSVFLFLLFLSLVFLIPVAVVFINSFKSRFYISSDPFSIPFGDTFAGVQNYINGLKSTDFINSFLRSLFITVFSVLLIVVCTSMAAWYLVRVKNKITSFIYTLFVFSMIVPFQMVMYTMTYVANLTSLDNLIGIIFIYLGFGSGLSVFMMSGFIKSIPKELEEAAIVDGCSPLQTFFYIIFPILKPTVITVAILNSMWIWNDYLLPYLILGTDEKTIPVAIQIAMQGAYGSVDYGGFMAMLVCAIIPIIVFYLSSQKHIIKGVVAGAVKG